MQARSLPPTLGRRPRRAPTGWLGAWLAACSAALLGACRSAEEWSEDADEQVYAIVAAEREALAAELDGAGGTFTIAKPAHALRERLLAGEVPPGPLIFDLERLLEVGSDNSREYQRQREALYLAALDLTLAENRFESQYGAGAVGRVSGTGEADLAEVSPFARVSRVLESGASLVADLGLRIFRNLSNGDSWDVVSDLGFTFTQPLLRGAGQRIAREPLTQAERDVIYAVRAYERFRRTFAFDVVTRMFRVLEQEDSIQNEVANHENLRILVERNEALAQAGRLSDIEVDQARQDELSSRIRIVEEQARLAGLLDNLKLFLGLPIPVGVAIDPAALEDLEVSTSAWLDTGEERAIELALARRLDYLTDLDVVDDAERRALVTADALRAQLDFTIDAQVSSDLNQPLDVSIDDVGWIALLDLDLPLERTAERNAFRRAQIFADAARRQAEQAGDSILLDVREALREARSTRDTYAIQRRSVELAENRVESTRLNFDAGRATTRDLLEAQEALLEAQNSATSALVDHHLSLLALFRDMEILRVDETGLSVDEEALALLTGSQP